MKKCEKCGKEFEDSMQSCDTCGGALTEEKPQETEEKTFCIYCGGEIAAGDTYCTKCGKSAVEEGKRHCIHRFVIHADIRLLEPLGLDHCLCGTFLFHPLLQ